MPTTPAPRTTARCSPAKAAARSLVRISRAGVALFSLIAAALLSLGIFGSFGAVSAVVFELPERALRRQFPDARVERKAVYLRKTERAELERQLGFRLDSRLHTFYVARRGQQLVGYATFDTHRVRTKEETLLVVLDAVGAVRHVEVISFFEPREYLAPPRWLRLFVGRRDRLNPGVDLPAISGATMTTNAVSRTVRKVVLLKQLHFGN